MINTFPVTFFRDLAGQQKWQRDFTFDDLADHIGRAAAPTKLRLWLLKLATFGDKRSVKNCLRNDQNVLAVYGVEADYDGEQMSFNEAVARVRSARVLSILYASPSHTPDKPHWRALFPSSGPLRPAERAPLADRANGIMGGTLARETWTLSQAFYYGRVNEHFRIETVLGDPIDTRGDIVGQGLPGGERAAGYDLVGSPAIREEGELSAYGRAALASAAANILNAPNKTQELTLNSEAFNIGRLAGCGGVPARLAEAVLLKAAKAIPSYDPAWLWSGAEIELKVKRAFAQGLGKPRPEWADVEREFDMRDVADV